MDLSRQVTECSNWSELLPQAIKEAKDHKIGKYLDGYKLMLEREKQLEELESQTHMSAKYRRFLSYTNISESERGSAQEINSRLYKPANDKVYLTSIIKSKSDLSALESKGNDFEVESLNESLTKSYITKLNKVDADSDTPENRMVFKKKNKAEFGLENVETYLKEDEGINFDKAYIKDLPPFDISKYTLPKEKALRESAINKIYNDNLIDIDKKLSQLNNEDENDKVRKILSTHRSHEVSDKFNNIQNDLDDEFAAIERLCDSLTLNDDDVKEKERAINEDRFEVDNHVLDSLDSYSKYINTEIDRIDAVQNELSKLIR